MGFETSASLHRRGGQLAQMQPWDFYTRDFYTRQWKPGSLLPHPLLLPDSPNLYPHFDAIHLYGLHLKIHAWGKEESRKLGRVLPRPEW